MPAQVSRTPCQFQSTLPARGATDCGFRVEFTHAISIHAPRTGSDIFRQADHQTGDISIHAPRTGSDPAAEAVSGCCRTFQSTLPARGATTVQRPRRWTRRRFQSTLPARGATPARGSAECVARHFNPRSPHGERPARARARRRTSSFQSTLPARGATDARGRPASQHTHFNPRSPHGERHVAFRAAFPVGYFNPRSPHGERHWCLSLTGQPFPFQSTLPARGATTSFILLMLRWMDFNPRSPHGERHPDYFDLGCFDKFQSTLPARGATQWTASNFRCLGISIHAPRTGSDDEQRRTRAAAKDFNPRSPHGERLRKVTILSIRIIGFAQKVYHKTVLLRISLAENAVILPKRPQNPVRTSLQKAGGLRFARAIRAARPYSISSPSGA